MSIELYLLAVLAVLSAFVGPWYARRLKRDAELYSVWQDRFFEKLDRVVDSGDATPEMLRTALVFGKSLRNRATVWVMVWMILSGEARKPAVSAKLDLSRVPDKTAMDFCLMVVAWFHAVSHTAVIRGWMMRNLMFPLFRELNDTDETSHENAEEQAELRAELRPYCDVATASLPKQYLAAA